MSTNPTRPPPLWKVLEAMGQKPTEEELFQMISEVDDNMSGSIDFPEFLKVRSLQNDLIYTLNSSSWFARKTAYCAWFPC